MTREDTCVNDEEVICAVHLGVYIHDGGSPVSAIVSSQFGGTCRLSVTVSSDEVEEAYQSSGWLVG
jgi:hypothetical protein